MNNVKYKNITMYINGYKKYLHSFVFIIAFAQ